MSARNRRGLLLALLPLVLAPAMARGQGLGLDLSEGSPAGDCSPSFALLGVASFGVDGHVLTKPEQARFARLADAMLAGARLTGRFSIVLDPSQARAGLGGRASEIESCETAECLDGLAEALGVERVASVRLASGPRGLEMSAVGFARAEEQPRTVAVAPISSGDVFDKHVGGAWRELLHQLSTHLGKLTVHASVPQAAVMLGDRPLGSGDVEERVPAGHHRLTVSAEGFQPFEQDVVVEPDMSAEVEATLVPAPQAIPVVPLVASRPAEPPASTASLWSRPGLYLAAAGAVAIAVGAGFGASARSMESRGTDADRDGIRDITRVEMLSAHSHAITANVLFGVGAAALAGGTAWLFVEPVVTPSVRSPEEPVGIPSSAGLMLSAGGSF